MERKFTDNEIVKALECCFIHVNCTNCPAASPPTEGCLSAVCKQAIDLYNRQKAEMERLKEAYALYEETTGLKWARAEAIKEFGERVKDLVDNPALIRGRVIDIIIDTIDNLVKEMTGENNGN